MTPVEVLILVFIVALLLFIGLAFWAMTDGDQLE